MSNRQLKKPAQHAEIPCLFLPMHDRTLLVPTVTVAEMVPMGPFEDRPDTPDWFLGYFHWRGLEVPLVSYELLSGGSDATLVPQGRIAVMNNTGVSEDLPFIALPTTGLPRMARLSAEDLKDNPASATNGFEQMRVQVGQEELVIPEISALEHAFLKLAENW